MVMMMMMMMMARPPARPHDLRGAPTRRPSPAPPSLLFKALYFSASVSCHSRLLEVDDLAYAISAHTHDQGLSHPTQNSVMMMMMMMVVAVAVAAADAASSPPMTSS